MAFALMIFRSGGPFPFFLFVKWLFLPRDAM